MINTIFKDEIIERQLKAGFDQNGEIVYGQMAFMPERLPDPDRTVITDAYLVLQNKNALNTQQDIRFTIELAGLQDVDYQSVKQREKIEFIGYEVSNAQLKERSVHHFIFDSFGKQHLEQLHATNQPFYFIVRATSAFQQQNALVDWHHEDSAQACRLMIKYIERRKSSLPAPTDLNVALENNKVKLTWQNPQHRDLVGAFVVRNCFHPPKSPLDGVKLYAGPDEYTYDNFANPNVAKYYSVFTYDDVPNYSLPVSVFYSTQEVIPVEEEEYELQDEEEPITQQQ